MRGQRKGRGGARSCVHRQAPSHTVVRACALEGGHLLQIPPRPLPNPVALWGVLTLSRPQVLTYEMGVMMTPASELHCLRSRPSSVEHSTGHAVRTPQALLLASSCISVALDTYASHYGNPVSRVILQMENRGSVGWKTSRGPTARA